MSGSTAKVIRAGSRRTRSSWKRGSSSTADVFDALTADRPYRKAFPISKALAIMAEDVGKAIRSGLLRGAAPGGGKARCHAGGVTPRQPAGVTRRKVKLIRPPSLSRVELPAMIRSTP